MYTDGSKTTEGVGSDFVLYNKNTRLQTESFTLPHHATVFQAEITAIYQATQYILSILDTINIRYIKILSDSQAAIQALANTHITSKSVFNALESMETLASQVKVVTLSWIKAHVYHEGNEQADQAAKEGAAGGMHINKVNTNKPWCNIKAEIDEYTRLLWRQKWESEERFKHTKEFYGGPNKQKSRGVMGMGTHTLSNWIKAITGHNNLAYFQSKLDSEISPICRLCHYQNETLYHLITECEVLANQHLDIMANKIPLPDMEWSIKRILKFI